MPPEGVEGLPHEAMLSFEEIERLAGILAGLGVKRIRLTGGEPTVRRGIGKLTRMLGETEGIEEVVMTSNGLFSEETLEELLAAGLKGLNISLDTLSEEAFERISRGRGIERVLHTIDRGYEAGLSMKINCVPILGMEGQEPERVAEFARDRAIDVRYIELMPLGCGKMCRGISSEQMLERLRGLYGPEGVCGLKEESCAKNGSAESSIGVRGPARYVSFEGFRGRVGFISPLSHAFCSECNRIRLTGDGFLKLCLHYELGLDLKALLRGGASDEAIREAVIEVLKRKPDRHSFGESVAGEENRRMNQIGG